MDNLLQCVSKVFKQHSMQLLNMVSYCITNTDYSLSLRGFGKSNYWHKFPKVRGQTAHTLIKEKENFPRVFCFPFSPLNKRWILNEFDCLKWSSFKMLTDVYIRERGAPRLLLFSTVTFINLHPGRFSPQRLKLKKLFDLRLCGTMEGRKCENIVHDAGSCTFVASWPHLWLAGVCRSSLNSSLHCHPVPDWTP